MIMKKLLLLAGVVTVLTTTGCLVSEGEWHGHSREYARYYERRDDVIVGPPAVVVRVPEVVVRPPEIIVR